MSIVSKRVRYALHGLGYIAAFSADEPVPFNDILAYLRRYSQRLTLSPSYIAKIFQDISRAGFTAAVSGPHGGYRLAREPEQIHLIEIVEALDGPLLTGCCLLFAGSGPCDQQATCGVRGVIHEAEVGFYRFFEKETVATLAERMSFPDLDESTSLPTAGPAPQESTRG